jgi:hypothetical protein
VQSRRQADVGFRQLFRHVLFWVVDERRQLGCVWQLDGCADVAHETVNVVFAGFAVEPAGLAEARVVYQVSDYAFHEVFAVDED